MPGLRRLGLLVWIAPLVAWAIHYDALQPRGYVNDFAGVIDDQTEAQLERYCRAVEKATGAQIALVTIPSLEGEPIEDVANTLFRKWGVGRKETNEGILLLLAIQDKRSRLEVGYGLEPYIPDGFAGSLLRQMRPALRAGDYGQALILAVQTIGQRIAEAEGVSIEEAPLAPPAPSPPPAPAFPVAALLPLIVFLFLAGSLAAARRQRARPYRSHDPGDFLTGMLLGSLIGKSMGGIPRGGGPFGGYDSLDGFGGFGGGDSGGGGASSSW